MCKRRVHRIVACDAIKFLVKYIASGSAQTKEASARTLRQIAVEPYVRGMIVQQGGLKACCTAACDEDNQVLFYLQCFVLFLLLFFLTTCAYYLLFFFILLFLFISIISDLNYFDYIV